ncbi:hypothetical protein WJX74_003064 [Apatococcus lobatus]|uniref:Uncharacterized protein n=1 Tax=Apatococcus lobatus TaxID=904363 RepID=A0AAW1Q6B8_9CHLO
MTALWLGWQTLQGIAWFPEKERALLETLHRWAVVLPHMMLFHCCEGYDMEEILKVIPPTPQVTQVCIDMAKMNITACAMPASGMSNQAAFTPQPLHTVDPTNHGKGANPALRDTQIFVAAPSPASAGAEQPASTFLPPTHGELAKNCKDDRQAAWPSQDATLGAKSSLQNPTTSQQSLSHTPSTQSGFGIRARH